LRRRAMGSALRRQAVVPLFRSVLPGLRRERAQIVERAVEQILPQVEETGPEG
jgi:hypothetical protein